jgi:multicomponent K+:H+ antiporter subunit F
VLDASLQAAIGMLTLALALNFIRLVKGPDFVDRILALDTLYINSAALLVLYGVRLGTDRYYEAALIIAMLGFLGTAALAKYLTRGDIIE